MAVSAARAKDNDNNDIHKHKNKDDKKKSQTSSRTSSNHSADNFLLGVCGFDTSGCSTNTTPSVLFCGESMLSKVTNLFGGGTASTGEDDEEALPVEQGNTHTHNHNHNNNMKAVTTTTKDKKKEPSSNQDDDGDDEEEEEDILDRNVDSFAGKAAESTADTETKKSKQKTKKDAATSRGENGDATSPKIPKKKKFIKKGDGEKSPKPKSPKPKKKKSTAESSSSPIVTSLKSADSEDGNLNEDDVDDMLKNLEIPDFNISMDEIPEDQFDENNDSAAASVAKKPWDMVDWKERMSREEVYSKRYRPNRAETRELEVMAEVLGLSKSSSLFGLGGRMSMGIGIGSKLMEDAQTLFFGEHSILLSILPVQWNGIKCELLLLTDGFVLKYRTFNSFNPLEKRYETCLLWDSVDFLERSAPFVVTIHIDSSTQYEIEAVEDSETSLDTIFKYLERVITQHDEHDTNNLDRTDRLGWQYLRVHKPAFTAAVTGNPKLLLGKHETASRGINELDRYNQYAPLHYAILQDECNPHVIKALLKAGADPNVLDGDERSAMYYAERNELSEETMEMLKTGGGQKSKLAEMEMRGELFSGVEAANQKVEQRRERDRIVKEHEQAMKDQKAVEALAKAEGAQNEMSKAMGALIERGEKIEQMDQKTKDLEAEAKTFGDLAARLKDEVKNKKWYQL